MRTVLEGELDAFEYDPSTPISPKSRFSKTYKGKRISDGSPVILKQLHPRLKKFPEEVTRFKAEGNLTPGLKRSIFPSELILTKTNAFQVRPFFEGTDLRGMKYSKIVFMGILEAVREIHAAGYLHCDLKPSNILVSPDKKEVRIIDFGMALKLDTLPKRNPAWPYPFSFYYSPPEQMLGFTEMMGPWSDIYSLGIILFELLTGRKPYAEGHPAALMNLMLAKEVPVGDIKDEKLADIVRKMTFRELFTRPLNKCSLSEKKAVLQKGIGGRFGSIDACISALI